jgi:hypothetical protein
MRKWRRICVVLTLVLLVLQIANQMRTIRCAGRELWAALGADASQAEARPGRPQDGLDPRLLLPQTQETDPTAGDTTTPDLREDCISAYLSQGESAGASAK